MLKGKLKANFPSDNQALFEKLNLMETLVSADPKKPIDPSLIGVDVKKLPTGVNNEPVSVIDFQFSMINFNTAKLEIGKAGTITAPEKIVAKPIENN